MRFQRSWGNFVLVLIDFGLFEILLAIKLTVCCASDRPFLDCSFLNKPAVPCPNNSTATFIFLPDSLKCCQPQHRETDNRCHRQTETSVE